MRLLQAKSKSCCNMLHIYHFKDNCLYAEDFKRHKIYYIPADKSGIFQVLHGALFAGAAMCGVCIGFHLPIWLALSAGCMMCLMLKMYEQRVFLPQLTCVKRLPEQLQDSIKTNQKTMLICGFLIIFPLLVLQQYTDRNPAVIALAIIVSLLSLLQFLRQLRILWKGRTL